MRNSTKLSYKFNAEIISVALGMRLTIFTVIFYDLKSKQFIIFYTPVPSKHFPSK